MMNISAKRHKIKKPRFLRQNAQNTVRLGMKWRKPKGKQSKLRQYRKARGAVASIGYRTPKNIRGLHPCGAKEIIIYNAEQLKLANDNYCVRIAGTVGKKKRIDIVKAAEQMKVKLVGKK